VLPAYPDSLIRSYRAVIAALTVLVLFLAMPIPLGVSRAPSRHTKRSRAVARVVGSFYRSGNDHSRSKNVEERRERDRRSGPNNPKRPTTGRPNLSAYEDLGAWIDIYNSRPWGHPVAATERLKRRGVRTIFLQTSNYGARDGVVRPDRVAQFLKAAHRRRMRVVAWYVPSFTRPKRDLRRSIRAIRFHRDGHRFDGFGLDIEATEVGRISVRNRRLLRLSDRIRRKAGKNYPLAAITPDPLASLYWPRFPWRGVARRFDVMVPMGYFSFHASGYKEVLGYTTRAIRMIRRATQRVKRPIHFIGGIGGDAGRSSTRAFVRAVKRNNLVGASFYDAPVTSAEEWAELGVLAGRKVPVRHKTKGGKRQMGRDHQGRQKKRTRRSKTD
jgi:hypothetical protein